MRPRAEPERTCVACRGRSPKRDLIRVARRPDGSVSVDAASREPGRGAYVHRELDCIDRAIGRGGLERALRTRIGEGEAARLREIVRDGG